MSPETCQTFPWWGPYAALVLLLFGRWIERADRAWMKRNPGWKRGRRPDEWGDD